MTAKAFRAPELAGATWFNLEGVQKASPLILRSRRFPLHQTPSLALVFGEQKCQIIRKRVLARPGVYVPAREETRSLGMLPTQVENPIRRRLSTGNGILKIAARSASEAELCSE